MELEQLLQTQLRVAILYFLQSLHLAVVTEQYRHRVVLVALVLVRPHQAFHIQVVLEPQTKDTQVETITPAHLTPAVEAGVLEQ